MCHTAGAATHDFRPMRVSRRSVTIPAMAVEQQRLIRIAGFIAWIAVGLPVILNGADEAWRMTWWVAAFAVFGAALAIPLPDGAMSLRARITLGLQVLAVFIMVLLLCNGFEGTLLVLIAMALGTRASRPEAMIWIVAQTALLFAGIAIHWAPRPAFLIAPPYLGFQILAFVAFETIAREATARRAIAAAHAELRAVNEILADSSRIAERLRISRDLHDALGHHLTALSLNLEAAVHKCDGETRALVQRSQTLARDLLKDVRQITAEMQTQQGIDLTTALQPLIDDLPRPHVHLEVAPGIRIDDPERAHILVRCAQEILTNAARHSSAENLWLVITRDGDNVRIHGRDDGKGAAETPAGFGLTAMRERVEGAGGELRFTTQPGLGFEVIALVPARSGS